MKTRKWIFLLLATALFMLSACVKIPPEASPSREPSETGGVTADDGFSAGGRENFESVLSVLTDFIDGEGFVYGLSQTVFTDEVVSQYQCEGTPVCDAGMMFFWDGLQGGGWTCTGDGYEFVNSYDNGIYTNGLTATVPLGGLDLPNGISFDDPVDLVLQKLGLPFRVGDFAPDERDGMRMTLAQDENRTLVLHEPFNNPDIGYACQYALVFTEKAGETVAVNGDASFLRERLKTRTLCFFFEDDKTGTVRFSVKVTETTPEEALR